MKTIIALLVSTTVFSLNCMQLTTFHKKFLVDNVIPGIVGFQELNEHQVGVACTLLNVHEKQEVTVLEKLVWGCFRKLVKIVMLRN